MPFMPPLVTHGNRRYRAGMSPFRQAKILITETTGLAEDALHIYVAVLVFLGSCLLFRWRATQWKPWLLVLLAALAGEGLDIRDQLAGAQPIDWHESAKDLLNTLMVPTAILIAARFSRIFGREQPQP